MAEPEASGDQPTIIKKYANRRLYDTGSSRYVTLDHLAQLVKEGRDFVVHDAKTGADITRSVLTQIIVEQESKGENLLPITFLRQLIGMYGENLQMLVPSYLDHSMAMFAENQDRMRDQLGKTFGGIFPFSGLDEIGRKNMALFEQSMRMFAPFGGTPTVASKPGDKAKRLADIQKQIDALSRELTELTGKD